MQCSKCGYQIDDTAKFCTSCGASVQNPDSMETVHEDDTIDAKPSDGTVSKSLFGSLFMRKNAGFEYLFLAAFLAQFAFLPAALILYTTKSSLPGILSPVFTIVSFVLFVVCIAVYFDKTLKNEYRITGNSPLNIIFTSFTGILLILLFMLLFSVFYRQLTGFIPELAVKKDTRSMIYLAGLAAALLVMVILNLSAVVLLTAIFRYNLKMRMLGRTYAAVIVRFLARFPIVVVYSAISGVLLYLINYIQNMYSVYSSSILPNGFFRIFILYLFSAMTNAYLFFVLINISHKFLDNMDDMIKEKAAASGKFPVPVFPAAVLLLVVMLVILTVPFGRNSADAIIAEINAHQNRAEIYSRLGLAQWSIHESDLAYSKLLSLKGYLEGIEGLKNSRQELIVQSGADIEEAGKICLSNSYIPFFKGCLQLLANNNDIAIEQFGIAVLYPNRVQESYFGLMKAYELKGLKDRADEAADSLINSETYYDRMSDIQKFSTAKIERYLEKLQQIDGSFGSQLVYKAVEKTKYLDMEGALADLQYLQKKYPEEPMISYQIAKIANEYRNEQNRYSLVISSAQIFNSMMDTSGNKEDEINKKLFVAQMYTGANDLASAEGVLQSLYNSYPDDERVIEQYAYVLNENKKTDGALQVLDKALAKKQENIYFLYLSAICHINKNDPKNSLDKIGKLREIVEKNKEQLPALDKFLYNYSLAFSKIFTDDKAVVEEVERFKDNTILYNYLYSVKCWKLHDAAKSNEFISKVIQANKNLGYAYYIMGINFYEDTVRKGSTDFTNAEKYYLKSLELLPNHAEGYFALAHCYKKWGKNLEALRAFRKVAYLLPFEDHRVDPYGITVHAIGEISALSQYDVKEGN